MKKFLTVFHRSIWGSLFLGTFLFVGCTQKADKEETYVVMLSLDAFRWDYPNLAHTPNLHRIAEQGVKAEALIPAYPSKTFPNHYSMATGLYPDNHGITSNRFFDKELGFYAIGDRNSVENAAFYGGEPIWLTAEKQGVKAATFFWVGSEAPIGGRYPSFWKPYEQSISFEDRIDTVIHWLSLPLAERPKLIAWYYHEPDWTAHRDGATGPKTLAEVERLDSLLGIFLHKLSQLPHAHQVNFLVMSDHGMTDISPEKYINLSNYINREWFHYVTGGNPVYTFQPKDEYKEVALEALRSIPNLKVWERHDIPERLNFGSNPRIQDVVVEAEVGHSIGFSSNSSVYSGATHGYDNTHPDMGGIFYAQGPAFKLNYEHKAFENVNIYGIVAHVLELEPVKTDGKWDDIRELFKK